MDQYEPADQMYSVAGRLKDEASVKIEQQRDHMVKIKKKKKGQKN